MELGGTPQGGEKEEGKQEPKEPASESQATSSDPEPSKEERPPKQEKPAPDPSTKQGKPEEKQKTDIVGQEQPKQAQSPRSANPKEPEPNANIKDVSIGNRDERRVGFEYRYWRIRIEAVSGQNESDAPSYR